jgi:hypothetical protein
LGLGGHQIKTTNFEQNFTLGWLEDEPVEIPDPEADKPSDWDEEMDGEWEAGLVPNPACASAPGVSL